MAVHEILRASLRLRVFVVPVRSSVIAQAPLLAAADCELTAVIGSLAIGGAERIVVDWAARVHPARRVHIVVLRDTPHEWTPPPTARITRLGGADILNRLTAIGRAIAESACLVCVCHLLTRAERAALADGGARVVPVIHNAREGWIEDAATLAGAPHVIAVSNAAADELRQHGVGAQISVIRHLPKPRRFDRDARQTFRRAWRIPDAATVVGMIGAVKPQKDYPFAIRLLRRLLDERDVYLAILGGPVGKSGREAWHAVLDAIGTAGVRGKVAMPAFVADAAAALPAFDVLLNTSRYEGTSIATLEALVNGVPVVASRVGGQGELASEGLTLVDPRAPLDTWTAAVLTALDARAPYPSWAGFPSFRLWTLAHLARPFERTDRVLFVTANLNAGGAQRSLVNLAAALRGVRFEIAVTGESTADDFRRALEAAGVVVRRTAASRDAFDHAERLVEHVCAERIGTVCFWNVDPKIKLLVMKALSFTGTAFVDVSPGPNSFDEMRRADAFARMIGFGERDFHARLDRLVVKYRGAAAPAGAGNNRRHSERRALSGSRETRVRPRRRAARRRQRTDRADEVSRRDRCGDRDRAADDPARRAACDRRRGAAAPRLRTGGARRGRRRDRSQRVLARPVGRLDGAARGLRRVRRARERAGLSQRAARSARRGTAVHRERRWRHGGADRRRSHRPAAGRSHAADAGGGNCAPARRSGAGSAARTRRPRARAPGVFDGDDGGAVRRAVRVARVRLGAFALRRGKSRIRVFAFRRGERWRDEGDERMICPDCGGEGRIRKRFLIFFTRRAQCPKCLGTGEFPPPARVRDVVRYQTRYRDVDRDRWSTPGYIPPSSDVRARDNERFEVGSGGRSGGGGASASWGEASGDNAPVIADPFAGDSSGATSAAVAESASVDSSGDSDSGSRSSDTESSGSDRGTSVLTRPPLSCCQSLHTGRRPQTRRGDRPTNGNPDQIQNPDVACTV